MEVVGASLNLQQRLINNLKKPCMPCSMHACAACKAVMHNISLQAKYTLGGKWGDSPSRSAQNQAVSVSYCLRTVLFLLPMVAVVLSSLEYS